MFPPTCLTEECCFGGILLFYFGWLKARDAKTCWSLSFAKTSGWSEFSLQSVLSLRNGVISLVIQKQLRVEPLFLHTERSQLRWLWHLDTSLVRCSGHVPPGGDPEKDTGHVEGTMFLGWHRNALGFLPRCWPQWLERGKSRPHWFGCFLHNPTPDKR